MSDQEQETQAQTPIAQPTPEADAAGMTPLGINVIGCGPCGKLKTATGATIADLHRLQTKEPTGPVAGNPAGLWARVVIPMYVCLDCTIELQISDRECANLIEATKEDTDGEATEAE